MTFNAKTLEYSFILRAVEPIAHHSGTKGNVSVLNRATVVLRSGELREVAEVSGNTMRSGIRRALADLMLDELGLLRRGSFQSAESVRFIYNGGAGAGTEGTIKLDEMRALRALLPSVALLGGCIKGGPQEGQTEVHRARLVCCETEDDLQDWQRAELADFQIKNATMYEHENQEFRHDETQKPAGRFLLTDAALALVNDRASKRERAGEAEDEAEIEEAKGGMMPYSSQEVIAGSLWTWSVVARVYSEIEEATIRAGLSAFLRRAVVGSGKRVGRGRFVVHAARGFDHLRPAEALRSMTTEELSGPEHEVAFLEHIRSRADEARSWLGVK
jgi:hypothetical protein